jgi:hypothetical protein
MARKSSKQKPVSVRYWFFAIFLTWIPLINLVAVPLLALFGKDQSKENYYRGVDSAQHPLSVQPAASSAAAAAAKRLPNPYFSASS